MARLFVDQREIASPPTEFASLDEVLKHVQKAHLPPNLVIRQVHLDGLPMFGQETHNAPPRVLNDINNRERIEISTGSVWDVARESADEAIAYLDRITLAIPAVSASFQATPGREAFENLKQLYEGCYWIQLLLDRLQETLPAGPDNDIINSKNVADQKRRFIAIMKQMVEAQERSDFILISDILEFEILPSIPVWKEMLERFQGKIGARL